MSDPSLIKFEGHKIILFFLLFRFLVFFWFTRFLLFPRFFPGRTHPHFWGWKEWFWGSKISIDQRIVGGWWMWISIEIHINGGKLPLLNGLNLRFFVCGTRPESPSRMDYPLTKTHTAGTGIGLFVSSSN